MTPFQMQLVKSTWERFLPVHDLAMMVFFKQLDDRDCRAMALFGKTPEAQSRMFIQTLSIMTRSLGHTRSLLPSMHKLVQRHHQQGLDASDYACLCQVLINTLQATLGTHFSPQAKEAWQALQQHLEQALVQHYAISRPTA